MTCRGEMKFSLGVVEVGILRLCLSRGLDQCGVGSSGAVVSCLGGDGGRTPPPSLARSQPLLDTQALRWSMIPPFVSKGHMTRLPPMLVQ